MRTFLEILILLAVASLATASGWRRGRVLADMDHPSQSVLWTQQTVDHFAKFEMPLWDASDSGGMPLVGVGRSAVFFPTTFLHWMLPPKWSWLLAAWIKIAAGMIGAWLFARNYLTHSTARLICGVSFGLSGLMVQDVHGSVADILAVMPWVLWILDRMLWKPTVRGAAALSGVLALAFLSGDPSGIVSLLAVSIGFIILRIAFGIGGKEFAWAMAGILLSLIIAVGLSAVQVFPLAEYLENSDTISAFNSDIFQIHFPMFFGVISLVLSGWAIISGWRIPRIIFWYCALVLTAGLLVAARLILHWHASASQIAALMQPGILAGPLLCAAVLAGFGSTQIGSKMIANVAAGLLAAELLLGALVHLPTSTKTAPDASRFAAATQPSFPSAAPFPTDSGFAWVVPKAQYFPSRAAALSALPNVDLQKTVLVDPGVDNPFDEPLAKYDTTDDRNWFEQVGTSPLPTVRFIRNSPDRITIDVGPSHSGWLVVAEPLYPGWQATVFGESAPLTGRRGGGNSTHTPIIPADEYFRAIFLTPKITRVEMTYSPPSWRWGASISLIGLSAWLILLGAGLWPSLPRGRNPSGTQIIAAEHPIAAASLRE